MFPVTSEIVSTLLQLYNTHLPLISSRCLQEAISILLLLFCDLVLLADYSYISITCEKYPTNLAQSFQLQLLLLGEPPMCKALFHPGQDLH